MQIFSAKSLSEKLRAGKFFEEETISCFFAHGVFCATAGQGLLDQSDGEQLFSDKTSLNWGGTKSYFASSTRMEQTNVYGIII